MGYLPVVEKMYIMKGREEPECEGCLPVGYGSREEQEVLQLPPLDVAYLDLEDFEPSRFIAETTLEAFDPVFLLPWAYPGCPVDFNGCRLKMSVPKIIIAGVPYYDAWIHNYIIIR